MKPVFLDSVGLLALWSKTDQWHPAASIAFAKIAAARQKSVTTNLVLLECGNAVSRKPARQDVIRLRHDLVAHKGLLIPTEDDWRECWQEFEQGRPGDPGIVD